VLKFTCNTVNFIPTVSLCSLGIRLPRISSKYFIFSKKDWCTQCISVAALWQKKENLQTPKSNTGVVEDNQTRHAHRIPIAFCTDYYFHWAHIKTPFFQVLMHEFGCLTTRWRSVLGLWSPIPCVCLSLIPRLQLSKHLLSVCLYTNNSCLCSHF